MKKRNGTFREYAIPTEPKTFLQAGAKWVRNNRAMGITPKKMVVFLRAYDSFPELEGYRGASSAYTPEQRKVKIADVLAEKTRLKHSDARAFAGWVVYAEKFVRNK